MFFLFLLVLLVVVVGLGAVLEAALWTMVIIAAAVLLAGFALRAVAGPRT